MLAEWDFSLGARPGGPMAEDPVPWLGSPPYAGKRPLLGRAGAQATDPHMAASSVLLRGH